MPLVTSKEMLLKAQKGGYAVGAFNAENMEMVKAIIQAAEELKAPVMIQTTPSTVKYGTVDTYAAIVAAEAKKASVPVCLHLDHGSSFELAMQAMHAGYTSVMIDGSKLDFEAKYQGKAHNEIDLLGENINKLSDSLEKTISELKTANNELQRDVEKKEAIDEMRKEFLANVSHELKTPIALIQGYAEGLQEEINDDPESRQFYCDVIVDEAAKMNNMVKKLLTLNQLEFGNDVVAMERFDLTALVKNYIQSAAILTKQHEITVRMEEYPPIYAWADEFKIEEVFMNFFSNAVNHCEDDKIIEVKMEQKDGKVRVSVFNTGKPIPEDSIHHIWEKFYKVDKARTREYGGSGVGLSIVKAIMESMNQQFGVNNYNNGVEFWFELETK